METPHNTITIQHGVPEAERRRTATLYYEAFRQKLAPIIGEPEVGIPLLEAGLVPECGIVALVNGAVVGVAGLHLGDVHFSEILPFTLLREFGWWSGLRRMVWGMGLGQTPESGELLVDGIAVSEAWRGRGIGTTLLEAVFAYARKEGYRLVRLEVVDTNPAAQRLYERMGFEAIKVKHTGFFTQTFGFRAVTTMIKMV